MIERSIQLLSNYVINEGFKGYDPYDTLNSWFPFDMFGNRIATYAIQFQKLNPINIRGGIGISKEHNPKGIGLFLKAFCVLHKSKRDSLSKHQADILFDWLKNHSSKHYKLPCWGYNFDWATLDSYLEADTPSVVVTSFVVDGLWEYYKLTDNEEAKNMILGAAQWIRETIPIAEFDGGISYAYTAQSKGACYNASLLAAEVLAKADKLSGKTDSTGNVNRAIDFVLSKQKDNGEWWYSYDPISGTERKQIDFHQGFVLMSLRNLNAVLPESRTDIEEAIVKGLDYYRNQQFFKNGKSLWRIPKQWPVDIHNQSQGIITLSELSSFHHEYLAFSQKIAEWTIRNMQDPKGYFYYRKFKHYSIKIPYMRWSQAWMLLALATLSSKMEGLD